MGFGGGALIASPLSQILMDYYRTPTSVGVAKTFLTLGVVYFAFMFFGAFLFRVPPRDWKPPGWVAPVRTHALITKQNVHVDDSIKTPQFYLLWAVLFLNVTAGIGILEQASPMIQEMFAGRVKASAAAGFVGLLSIFNMAGRFLWSSASDRFGRKVTYAVFFSLGPALYMTIPHAGQIGSIALFASCVAVIITMYGGGFATIPAYLADIFGTQFVGAIHGRLLTAWSAAGVAGPVLVNYIREYLRDHGVPGTHAYDITMYLMAGLLIVGFFCNLAVRPVHERFYMTESGMRGAEQPGR